VPRAAHDPIEGDLDHHLGHHAPVAAEVAQRDRGEALGHGRDLGIGQAGVGLADGEQAAVSR
jgi:hypothetical protein